MQNVVQQNWLNGGIKSSGSTTSARSCNRLLLTCACTSLAPQTKQRCMIHARVCHACRSCCTLLCHTEPPPPRQDNRHAGRTPHKERPHHFYWSPHHHPHLRTTAYANLDLLPLLEAQVDLRYRGSRLPRISARVAATLSILLKLSAPLNVPARVNRSRTGQTDGHQVWVIRARQVVVVRSGLYHEASV